jgi:hypothetical protein
VRLVLTDFNFDITFDPYIDSKSGALVYRVMDADINFGESYLYHDSWIVAMVMEQVLYYLMVIFENTIFLFGDLILSRMLGPIVDELTNDYRFGITLPSLFPGQGTQA